MNNGASCIRKLDKKKCIEQLIAVKIAVACAEHVCARVPLRWTNLVNMLIFAAKRWLIEPSDENSAMAEHWGRQATCVRERDQALEACRCAAYSAGKNTEKSAMWTAMALESAARVGGPEEAAWQMKTIREILCKHDALLPLLIDAPEEFEQSKAKAWLDVQNPPVR